MIFAPPRLPDLKPAQQEQFALLSELLLSENRRVNLTAIRDPDEVRLRHFEDSLAALPFLEEMRAMRGDKIFSLIDVGSGAGFPSLALAIALPWCRVTSLEATGKKIRFQEKAARELGLDNMTVLQGRAEDLGHDPAHRERYDAATARALAAFSVVAELTLPFVSCGGVVVAWKGPRADAEITDAAAALDRLGGRQIREIPYALRTPTQEQSAGAEQDGPLLRLIILGKNAPTPPRYPRSPAQMKKRPL